MNVPSFSDSTPETGRLAVMTRVLKLPARTRRQARAMVRMQIDRLSPLPAAEVVFDVAILSQEGAQGVFALGMARKADLSAPTFAAEAVVVVHQTVDGVPVEFRFPNSQGVDQRERRLLRHAPAAALLAMGLAALALASAIKAESWRGQQLPMIASSQRQAAVAARSARQLADARQAWTALDRSDAAVRLVCISTRLDTATPVRITALNVGDDGVMLRLSPGVSTRNLEAAGAELTSGQDGAVARFGPELCT